LVLFVLLAFSFALGFAAAAAAAAALLALGLDHFRGWLLRTATASFIGACHWA